MKEIIIPKKYAERISNIEKRGSFYYFTFNKGWHTIHAEKYVNCSYVGTYDFKANCKKNVLAIIKDASYYTI